MDYAYQYGDPARLYLNVTNRCTNRCSFCVRILAPTLGDATALWGDAEPDLPALLAAIRARARPDSWREVIWCGFGEPTYRLDLITAAAGELRRLARSIRLNTNGHACLIHGRDVLPELASAVDAVHVSLNAPTPERYGALCRPVPIEISTSPETLGRAPGDRTGSGDIRAAWNAMLDFLTRAPRHFREVQASVVGAVLSADEIEACRDLARARGVDRFRVR